MHPVLSILVVLFALSLLLIVCSAGVKKQVLCAESARKLVHVGMGVICMTFPWLFADALPVQILAVLAVSGMLIVRLSKLRANIGSALFSVSRLSFGELLFPIAVAWLFTLYLVNSDSVVFYVIPLLLLTFADTAGAIAGTRLGRKIYKTTSGSKSVEGSIAFFITAFLCIFLVLCFGSVYPVNHILVIAITIGIFITSVEGASGMGIDNLVIPIGAYFLLSYYSELSTDSLWIRAGVLSVILLIFILLRNKHRLNGGAVLSASLLCFIAYMMGGVYCLLASILVFVRHMVASYRIPAELRHTHSIEAILAVSAPTLTWLTLARGKMISQDEGAAFFIASLAVTLSMLYLGTRKFVTQKSITLGQLCVSSVLAIIIISLTYPLLQSISFIFFSVMFSIVASVIFHRLRSGRSSDFKDWIILCVITYFSTISLYFLYATTH